MIDVNTEKGKERKLQAQFNVVNGTDVHVVGRIYGPSINLLDFDKLRKMTDSVQNPKTVTVVYAHNTTKTRNRKVNLGQRQRDDKVLNFQRKNVTFAYRFAEAEFDFKDEHKTHYITSVDFSFDVNFSTKFGFFF